MTHASSSPRTTDGATVASPHSEPAGIEPAGIESAGIESAKIEPAGIEPALVDGVDVDAVARAVRACAGVSDLYSGRLAVGSYLPGRRVAGVQVDDGTLTVQVRARWGHSPRDVFAQIDGVTASLRHGRVLDLVVADIDDDLGPTSSPRGSDVPAVDRRPALEARPTPLPLPESSPS